MTLIKAPGKQEKHATVGFFAKNKNLHDNRGLRGLFEVSLTSGEAEGMVFSTDTRFRESSELELCPSAAESFELKVGTEFLLVSLSLLEEVEEEDADE